ncbi:MAG: hypothetical protein M3Y91_06740 [Actinomycetota bacterium]|nr:hypothetical protein [Actinomycetota bacterium]
MTSRPYTCPYCAVELAHRPYAGKRDMPSSSTVANLVDDGKSRSFGWSAAGIAAVTAVHHPDDWTGLGTDDCTHDKTGFCPACRYLRSEFDRQWTAKANLGTHVHHLAQSWAEGVEVDVDATCEPYMDAVEAFYHAADPEWVHLERTVLYDEPRSHAYRGQFDGICVLNCPTCPDGPRCKWLIDWKSGGFYPSSQSLQLSSYRQARHLTRWVDGTETIDEPMPAVAHAGVILLGADGGYQVVDLPTGGDTFGTFLRLRDVWAWNKTMAKWAREHPLEKITDLMTNDESVAA